MSVVSYKLVFLTPSGAVSPMQLGIPHRFISEEEALRYAKELGHDRTTFQIVKVDDTVDPNEHNGRDDWRERRPWGDKMRAPKKKFWTASRFAYDVEDGFDPNSGWELHGPYETRDEAEKKAVDEHDECDVMILQTLHLERIPVYEGEMGRVESHPEEFEEGV